MAKEKLTLYFPAELVDEAKVEAARQDRSISWIMQMAWMVAREHLRQMPGIDDLTPGNSDGEALPRTGTSG